MISGRQCLSGVARRSRDGRPTRCCRHIRPSAIL